jgi:probable O-glycosylation ligase (exosortase A-associated)
MISDNNCLGLVLIVLLPLMNYLRVTSRVAATRLTMLGVIACNFLAIFGTYSRGALVALAAAGAAYAMRSRSGILLVALAAILVGIVPSFLPAGWTERMSTLNSVEVDDSFNGRVEAWRTSYNIASARPLVGGGFAAVEVTPVVQQLTSAGSLAKGRAAHSIFFEVLGDHGFVGLGLYLLILAAAWLNTLVVLNAAGPRPDLAWAHHLARMMQVSLVAFLVGGAALSMAYYDGMLMLFALTGALAHLCRQPAREASGETAPSWKRARPAVLKPALRPRA